MHARSEYEEFLTDELAEIVWQFDSHRDRSYCAFVTLAAGGKDIYEHLLSMYLVKLPIDSSWLISMAAEFWGMDFLIPHCECGEIKDDCLIDLVTKNPYRLLGEVEKLNESKKYLDTKAEIITLAEKMDL